MTIDIEKERIEFVALKRSQLPKEDHAQDESDDEFIDYYAEQFSGWCDARRAALASPPLPLQEVGQTELPWRCFHCEETFDNRDAAAKHFGPSERYDPACQVDIEKYREMQDTVTRYCEEDTDLHRQIYGLQSDMATTRKRAEEEGYARGLRDGGYSRAVNDGLEHAARIIDEEESNAREERYHAGLVGALEECGKRIRASKSEQLECIAAVSPQGGEAKTEYDGQDDLEWSSNRIAPASLGEAKAVAPAIHERMLAMLCSLKFAKESDRFLISFKTKAGDVGRSEVGYSTPACAVIRQWLDERDMLIADDTLYHLRAKRAAPIAPALPVAAEKGKSAPLKFIDYPAFTKATAQARKDTEWLVPVPLVTHPDDVAVDRFAQVMKEKLAKKRGQGYSGWDDSGELQEHLSKLLIEHVAKGDPVDVANFAMMLHQRGERISAHISYVLLAGADKFNSQEKT